MGVVYYANYLAFFETGRVEALRQIGAAYSDVVRQGVHLVVIEAVARYHRPAVFDDVLLVACHARDVGRTRFSFVYEISREADGAPIASGHTVHACVDATSLRVVRTPAWLVDELRRLA
jgi:acyl-CoA thioester hydrolase